MPAWGLKDNVLLTGNVTVSDISANVNGFGTIFEIEVDNGDYIGIAGVKYQVDAVKSNTLLTLNGYSSTTSANVKAYVQQGPKYVSNIDLESNVYTIQRIYGVSAEEANVPANQAKNLKTPGWNHFQEFTGGHGQTRVRGEVLVAMSKNFKESEISDWDDDDILLDYFLVFSTQPEDQEVEANASVTINTVAESEPDGAAITYQWYESPNNIVFAALSDTGVYSGTDSNTLEISNVANLDGYFYKLEIDTTEAAESNVSETITITHL